MTLTDTGETGRHERCYLSSTNACSTKISAEHPFSEAALRVLAEREVEVEGTLWLKGQKKVLSFKSLTANCLCQAHNSALSPIDAAGARFFAALQQCSTSEDGPNQHHLFSGYDVERWLLKIMAGYLASKNFAIDGEPIDPTSNSAIDFIDLLEDVRQWKSPLGVYVVQSVGDQLVRRDTFAMAPLLIPGTRQIAGMVLSLQGIHFGLLALNRPTKGTVFGSSIYRPETLNFRIGHLWHKIQMSWDDNFEHGELVLTHQRG